MNFPSSPNPNFTELDEIFNLDPDFSSVSDVLKMIGEEINREDSPSSTWSTNSSEKVPPDSISPPASMATSITSLEMRDGEERKRERPGNALVHVFRTKSTIDTLDDGYKWRKYGKKPIRGSPYPRHYHKCSNPSCSVKKRIERDTADPDYVLTTYKGTHNHGSPSVVYCDPDEIEFMSRNSWCFENNFSLSRSAP